MKKLLSIMIPLALVTTAGFGQNLLTNADFSAGIDTAWEGFSGGAKVPSTFVSVTGTVATVTPDTPNELNFYQTFGAGANPALTEGVIYTFSLDAANITTDVAPVYFVKAFDSGWGFIQAEFQSPTLVAGTNTLTFTTQPGTTYYQVGTLTDGATTGSYDVSNMTLVPEPSTVALLFGAGALGFAIVRRRTRAKA